MNVSELLGFTSIAAVAFLTLIFAVHWPRVGKILMIALAVRVAAILVGYFIAPLPDSGVDARTFERVAWEWAQGGLIESLGHYTGPHSYFISWILAVLYSVTDRSLLMAQSVSLLFGMGTVFMGWLLARKLWGDYVATKAGWVLAVFPTLILYSALTMREAYIWFFVAVSLYGVTGWFQAGSRRFLLIAVLGFIGATFFHGAMLVGALAFLGLISMASLRRLVGALRRRNANLVALSLTVVTVALIGTYVAGGFSVPKLGTFENATDITKVVNRMETYTRGSGGEEGAAYPRWTVPNSIIELTWKAPVRAVYFAYSPFPWDVRTAMHLVGLIDGMLYVILSFLIWRNRKLIWHDPALRAVLLITGAYFIVFGLAIGNFGTGIRHRSKFVIGLIILAAPLLPSFRMPAGGLVGRRFLLPSQTSD